MKSRDLCVEPGMYSSKCPSCATRALRPLRKDDKFPSCPFCLSDLDWAREDKRDPASKPRVQGSEGS